MQNHHTNDETRPVQGTVMTLGTFDLFHYGHLRIIERAAAQGSRLVVGVATDAYNYRKKSRFPVYPESQRMAIVGALRCVDEVFLEEGIEHTREYCKKYNVSVVVMGHDKIGEFEYLRDEGICEVAYLPRTENVSTTDTIALIKKKY